MPEILSEGQFKTLVFIFIALLLTLGFFAFVSVYFETESLVVSCSICQPSWAASFWALPFSTTHLHFAVGAVLELCAAWSGFACFYRSKPRSPCLQGNGFTHSTIFSALFYFNMFFFDVKIKNN